MQSQPNVPQLLNLRDMAAQVALNFAGQTISSYDGTYTLLIDCIYNALLEVAQSKDMVVEKVYLVGLNAEIRTKTLEEFDRENEVCCSDEKT